MFDKSKLAVVAVFVAAAEALSSGAVHAGARAKDHAVPSASDTAAALLEMRQAHEREMTAPGKNQLWVCTTLALRDYQGFGRGAFVYSANPTPELGDGFSLSVVFDPAAHDTKFGSIKDKSRAGGFYDGVTSKGLSIVETRSETHPDGAFTVEGHLSNFSAGGADQNYASKVAEEAMGFTKFVKPRCAELLKLAQ